MIPMVFFLDGLQPSSSHDFLHWGCHNPVVGQFCSSDAMMMLNPLKSNIFRHPNIRVPDISYIYLYIYISICIHNYTPIKLSQIIQTHPHHFELRKVIPTRAQYLLQPSDVTNNKGRRFFLRLVEKNWDLMGCLMGLLIGFI